MELALTPDGRWEVGVHEVVHATRAAGFSALGLVADLAGPDAASAFGAAGLRCHELLALRVRDEPGVVATAEGLAEAAALVGAEWILTVLEVPLDARVSGLVRRCARAFEEAGVKMGIEFYTLSPVDSLGAASDVVEATRCESAGVVVDSAHVCSGGATWGELASFPLERIAYVQFTDASVPTPQERAAWAGRRLWRRAMPGEGDLDLERFAGTLRERGWAGTVSVEVLNRESAELPIGEFTRRACSATARYWS